jgi:peptide/nickel transport system permease protein
MLSLIRGSPCSEALGDRLGASLWCGGAQERWDASGMRRPVSSLQIVSGYSTPVRRSRAFGDDLFRRRAVRLLMADKGALLAVLIVTVTSLAALFAPVLLLPDPLRGSLDARLLPPFTPSHILGTDELGRDFLSRLVWGARPALVQGLVPLAGGTILGYALGTVTGLKDGWWSFSVMRLVEALLAIPPVMMAIAVAATLGPGLRNVVIAMTLVLIAPMARVARGAVVEARGREYVAAARSVGATDLAILARHILPNTVSPVLAYAMPLIGIMIVFASGLSFIGLGVQPPAPDWGSMVNRGRTVLATSPHVATFAGLAIFLIGFAFSLGGDWLRDVLDPRSSSPRLTKPAANSARPARRARRS